MIRLETLRAPKVEVQVLTADTASDRPQFGGSPTILFDGADPFAGERATDVGLSCRLYRTPTGIDGAPSVEQLRLALAESTRL